MTHNEADKLAHRLRRTVQIVGAKVPEITGDHLTALCTELVLRAPHLLQHLDEPCETIWQELDALRRAGPALFSTGATNNG